jgi:hypothetical protein
LKQFLIFIFIFASTGVFAQASKKKRALLAVTHLTKDVQLGFKSYSKKFKLYYSPGIIKKGKIYAIKGFENSRGCDLLFSLSPNKKYIVITAYEIGYVGSGKEKFLHENSFCYIVSLASSEVKRQMQSDCGGEWDGKNQWTNSGKIIFDGH